MNVPVLARTLELAGLSTLLVTNMPIWAERIGVPRTLAVEFPFGHALGLPHNAVQQTQIIEEALMVLETAAKPGVVTHSDEMWPVPSKEAIRAWQPPEPSPVIRTMGAHLRMMLRERRARSER